MYKLSFHCHFKINNAKKDERGILALSSKDASCSFIVLHKLERNGVPLNH